MQIYYGVLEGLSDQGAEGLVEYTFWPDNHAKLKLTFPILLESGDELKVIGPNSQIIWHGIIEFVPRRYWFGDKAKRNDLLHGSHKPKNVAYSDWLSWFCDKPVIRGELKRKN